MTLMAVTFGMSAAAIAVTAAIVGAAIYELARRVVVVGVEVLVSRGVTVR